MPSFMKLGQSTTEEIDSEYVSTDIEIHLLDSWSAEARRHRNKSDPEYWLALIYHCNELVEYGLFYGDLDKNLNTYCLDSVSEAQKKHVERCLLEITSSIRESRRCEVVFQSLLKK